MRPSGGQSEIIAQSLLAAKHLHDRELTTAQASSEEAINKLRGAGWHIPTVRAELILLQHAEVLLASGHHGMADDYLRQAWILVHSKARTLPDRESRQRFLTTESVNLSIGTLVEQRNLADPSTP